VASLERRLRLREIDATELVARAGRLTLALALALTLTLTLTLTLALTLTLTLTLTWNRMDAE